MPPAAVQDSPASLTSQLAILRRLEWRVRHAVENILSGEYRSAFRGRGMEFDQVVKYEFGDDVRDIDWNVTARLGEPYRKKFVEEREVTVLLVFEDSPSLQFGSSAQSKREALLELAGLVMLLAAVNRDRVGYVHATPGGYSLREPVRGRGQILHAASTLLGRPPPPLDGGDGRREAGDRTKEPGGSTSGGRQPVSGLRSPVSEIPWSLLSHAAPRHSVLIWLSDFPPRAALEGWTVLRRRYQTMGFRVDDPWERQLPTGDTLTAYDPLAGRLVALDGTAVQRAEHAGWVKRREAAFRDLFPDHLSRLVVSTEEPRLEALVRFFQARMGNRRRG
ncbi:MAG: hypothetical protein A3G75_07245 [Verrucomicrobia bacterium RIFCSPLOWO2_12_FULL_64_8]|nr:MAG: hypothetical protein A3G75_07245 [Verrucomicrobia bacterium RIFCSPLOWO2_12_FULL_64_8]